MSVVIDKLCNDEGMLGLPTCAKNCLMMAWIMYMFIGIIISINALDINDIPDNSQALFADDNGVFVLTDKEMILNKIKEGKTLRKIISHADMEGFVSRRGLQSAAQNEALLDIHNEYRSTTATGQTAGQPAATNMNKLMWDPYLAKVAQDYSAKCEWQHNPNRQSELKQYDGQTEYVFDPDKISVGENIYYSTAEESLDNILFGIQAYYNEYEYYTFNNDTDGCCSQAPCGHYTQVVWANTRYVGCGYTVCDGLSGAVGSGTDVVFKVCNYYPAGNFVGNSPYYAGCSCSNCASDRVCNNDGLCGGCGSLNWNYCSNVYGNCDELINSCPDVGCDVLSTKDLCINCKSTCQTCDDGMLAGRSQCNDGTSSGIEEAGTFSGRDITTPTESTFSGSPYCDGNNKITTCSKACVLSMQISVLILMFITVFVVC
eukprot:67150_1